MVPHTRRVTDVVRVGGCACGALRFRAHGEPTRVAICHCLVCRKAHGAPFAVFAIYAESAVEIEGPYAVWQSSPAYQRCFCPACGSRVFGREGGEIEMLTGAFDEVGVFAPQYEAWSSRREPWLPDLGIRQHARGRFD